MRRTGCDRRTCDEPLVRALRVLAVLPLLACQTVAAGLTDRAEALLSDYRARARPTFAAEPEAPRAWARGQFTVYARSSPRGAVLERVAITRRRGEAVAVAVEVLGGGEQLRARLTFARQPGGAEALPLLLTTATIRRGEGPEVESVGTAPADVLELAATLLIAPPGSGRPRLLEAPAGRFEGCLGEAHPAVPLSGVVVQRRDGVVRELLEFGEDGGGELF